jgi:hypothetical protein
LLKQYCYDCHGDGSEKGKVAFDKLSEQELFARRDLWFGALKNLRAQLMPPQKKPQPTAAEIKQIQNWIKRDIFGLDPQNPDPGRVTIRRLNRFEYHNTIHDLMGFDFNVEEELPPDDSGYGFDTIGDVLTMSPMLMEKYMQAAETIVAGAVPRVNRVVAEKTLGGNSFSGKKSKTAEKLSFQQEASLTNHFRVAQPGDYTLTLDLEVRGPFESDAAKCEASLTIDGEELWKHEFGWDSSKKFNFKLDQKWQPGKRELIFTVHPTVPAMDKTNSADLRLLGLKIAGPAAENYWVRPANWDLFFTKDPPDSALERRQYAREIMERFVRRAYRRPADSRTIDKLVAIAQSVYSQKGRRFQDGIAQAIIPVLASPRFLFRVEEVDSTVANTGFPRVDEYSLATRLSYFLWSTTPDEELLGLADKKQLRANLDKQVRRMLEDQRSKSLVKNFVGQWLQARDVEGIDINARAVLARDDGEEKELENIRQQFRQGQFRRQTKQNLTKEEQAEEEKRREIRRKFFRPRLELDRDLRKAMREETELCFSHVVRQNRSVLELLESDYTYLNEKLAKHYGMTNVTGGDMRLVHLPEGSPRGGVLTEGTVLVVTSNPTRTSPVKRGLFILDNILGVPPPPPPPDIPVLEDSEKGFTNREPTLREVLAIHREKPLCSSCHSRMDPLGLSLENFNAMGMWREQERKQPIEPAGQLITGESFKDIRELKHILATKRRFDFYRCLAEKMLTYALGRGLEYYDVETVDQIVDRLDRENGRFSALLLGIVESAPFQKSRINSAPGDHPLGAEVQNRSDTKTLHE